MSYYYQGSFTSPEGIFAIIREELKSYYDTGAIDDLLFPIYVNKCLNKLGKSSYIITEDILYLENSQARLPDNFASVREAWLCTQTTPITYQSPNSFYSQTVSTTIQIAPMIVGGDNCNKPECPNCDDNCLPEIVQAVYKTNYQEGLYFTRQYLLKPGNISAHRSCDVSYANIWNQYSSNITNPNSSGANSFDIRDNKFVTNFRTGVIYLIFYAIEYDNVGNQMVPDNFRIKEYIEAFIKYKMFETLTNQCNDETFNQLQQKRIDYKQQADEAFIMASVETKKQTTEQKINGLKHSLNRFRMYQLPGSGVSSRRRNN